MLCDLLTEHTALMSHVNTEQGFIKTHACPSPVNPRLQTHMAVLSVSPKKQKKDSNVGTSVKDGYLAEKKQ